MKTFFAGLVVLVGLACTPTFGQVVTAPAGQKIMIFGGDDHKTYLGCLSCSEYAEDSVLNRYGPNGSKYEDNSIFNRYGVYGGRYGDYSPCNQYSADPPVIVDANGAYYGRLSIGIGQDVPSAVRGWISGVCADQ